MDLTYFCISPVSKYMNIISIYKAECNVGNILLVLFMLVPKIMFVPLIYFSPKVFMLVSQISCQQLVSQFSCQSPSFHVSPNDSSCSHKFKQVPQFQVSPTDFKLVPKIQVCQLLSSQSNSFMLVPQLSCQSHCFHVSPMVYMLDTPFSCQSHRPCSSSISTRMILRVSANEILVRKNSV